MCSTRIQDNVCTFNGKLVWSYVTWQSLVLAADPEFYSYNSENLHFCKPPRCLSGWRSSLLTPETSVKTQSQSNLHKLPSIRHRRNLALCVLEQVEAIGPPTRYTCTKMSIMNIWFLLKWRTTTDEVTKQARDLVKSRSVTRTGGLTHQRN